jgi:hypothetical protein
MRLTDFYSTPAPAPEQQAGQSSPAGRVPMGGGTGAGGTSVAISWLGFLLALILLRIVYEMGD